MRSIDAFLYDPIARNAISGCLPLERGKLLLAAVSHAMADNITADNAARVFIFADGSAGANAENSRVFAGRGAARWPICTPYMPDKCLIFACPEAIFDGQPPEFAPRGSIAISSPVGVLDKA